MLAIEGEIGVGQDQQAPADQRKEEPIMVRHIEEIDDDQQGIHRDIDEQMEEEAAHPRIGEDRFFPPGALKQERKVVGGEADAPAASTQMNQIWSGLR